MAGVQQDGTRRNVFGREEPVYKFVGDDGIARPLYEVGERLASPRLSSKPTQRDRAVGDAAIGPPSVFLTLWALLFCLSDSRGTTRMCGSARSIPTARARPSPLSTDWTSLSNRLPR